MLQILTMKHIYLLLDSARVTDFESSRHSLHYINGCYLLICFQDLHTMVHFKNTAIAVTCAMSGPAFGIVKAHQKG